MPLWTVKRVKETKLKAEIKKNIFLDTNMENGGFRDLFVIEKMVICSKKQCYNIAKVTKQLG